MSQDNAKIGIGGGPTRCTTLPTDPAERKKYPIASGFFDYFPDAIAAIANLSWQGNEQHNAGQPLHWARSKSGDEADTMLRHFAQRGTLDSDGVRHSAKIAWRALALLQKEIEAEATAVVTIEFTHGCRGCVEPGKCDGRCAAKPVSCFAKGPQGYECTREKGHGGEHWATYEQEFFGTEPRGHVCERWAA